MTDLKIGFWDTEWSPHVTYTWTQRPKYIPNEMLVEDARLLCYGVRDYERKTTRVVDERSGRVEMLTSLRDWLSDRDVVVSYNGASFDTKKVNSEFMREGIAPPAPYKEVDLYRVVKKHSTFYSGKLGFIADRVIGDSKVDTGGFELWRQVLAGDEKAWRKFRSYQKQDVDLLVDMYEELKPWIRMPHPVTNSDTLVCRNCGSDNYQRRGVARSLQGEYPRYQCLDCATWFRGVTRTPVGVSRAV